ncbi:hypothetical protein E1162_19250 [Rhodobacteraceae bacterium RKSG542]|uniref:MGH1-like glycoside hydrolase domain-containing protein n=1 Tax=Pseudovibrio flavus TaxID=2529854 RepID=UPI0012BCDF8D|nr:trehalase family glycosidase [Pseudovibrio flavus]MTI19384.1 hypothetical protein [Pseudovibrio flavus]
MSLHLDEAARSILETNDLGGYTIPTKGLYPYQWNWDSAFVSLGFARFSLERAWQEIETLMEGQWPDGMVPHILFRKDDPSYFPGPSVWGTHGKPMPSSGHSQPPVAATAVRHIYELDKSPAARERLKVLFRKLLKWHRWFHTARDPQGLGVIAVMHPWESGRDNLPDWDEPTKQIDTSSVGTYQRKDTSHVDPTMRPKKADYDRYLALVQFGREHNWDPYAIATNCPFFVADPAMTFILLRADRDLLALAKELGEDEAATELEEWIARTESGISILWNEDLQAFTVFDLRSGTKGDGISSASFLAPYAGISNPQYIEPMLAHFDRIASQVTYMMPSYDPDHEAFEPMRYWRGPVWGILNYMIAKGLGEIGEDSRAARMRDDTAALIAKSGFAEYFNPFTGDGAGGSSFSWTSAIWLDWVTPTRTAGEA